MTAWVTAGDGLLTGVLEAVAGRGPLQLGLHLPPPGLQPRHHGLVLGPAQLVPLTGVVLHVVQQRRRVLLHTKMEMLWIR